MEIENKPNHTLLPNDFIVVLKDYDNQYHMVENHWNSELKEMVPLEAGSVVGTDLKVVRVDGDIIKVCFNYFSNLGSVEFPHFCKCASYLDIDVNKVEYKRVICNW